MRRDGIDGKGKGKEAVRRGKGRVGQREGKERHRKKWGGTKGGDEEGVKG